VDRWWLEDLAGSAACWHVRVGAARY